MSDAPGPRILFVDDEPDAGLVFARRAAALGYQVEVLHSGAEALASARVLPIPVVVTDLRMTGLDGYALIDAIGAICPETVFLISTADPEMLAANRLAGTPAIAGVMAKPWDAEDFAAKLALAFDLYGKRRLVHARGQSLEVLLVEDSPSDAFLLRQILGAVRGVRTTHVATLSDAIREVHSRPIDVVLTDLSLPDARGADAVLRLRSAASSSAVVVCSSIDDEAFHRQLISAGAHECIAKDNATVTTLGRTLWIAHERKQFEARILKMAHVDPLTGLSNRAGWQARSADTLGRAKRLGRAVALLAIDLDGFKAVNDTYGHDVGDAVLQEIGRRASANVREYDTVARLGGDELAVLLTDLEFPPAPREAGGAPIAALRADVVAFGERLLAALIAPMKIGAHPAVQVGASIGCAIYPLSADLLTDLMKLADEAMYRAKRAGGSRLELASEGGSLG